MSNDFYTPLEAARILGVSHRRILERLAAGEIEAELDPHTGRWRIPKGSVNSSEATQLTEAELAWRDEKALLQAELHKERARADEERERANREQEKAARERERAEGLRRALKELRAKRSEGGRRWRLFGG